MLPCDCACRSDSKEAERKKMAELLKAAAAARAAATGGQGPQMWVLDLQVGLVISLQDIPLCGDVFGFKGCWQHKQQQAAARGH
jgi:hypothetical protein